MITVSIASVLTLFRKLWKPDTEVHSYIFPEIPTKNKKIRKRLKTDWFS